MASSSNQPSSITRERPPVSEVEAMVHTFYGRVREDPVLGPVFAARIDDWPFHLERMVAFWRAVLRSEPGFTVSDRGSPPILHRRIAELELAHFERWLEVFDDVVEQVYTEPRDTLAARHAARRIAMALSRHLVS